LCFLIPAILTIVGKNSQSIKNQAFLRVVATHNPKMTDAGSLTRRKHIQDANLLHKESPYGNFYSPVIRPKIVGGRLIHVREEDPAYRTSRRDLPGPHPLSPRSRTQRLDSLPPHSNNAVEARRREKLKLRGDSLTERDAEQFSSGDASAPLSERLNPYQPLPPIGSSPRASGVAMETAQLLNGLYGRLPPYAGRLTSAPLVLGSNEEYVVMRELQSQLRYLETGKLKQVYTELADSDDELTGLCSFVELHNAFVRNNIFLADPLARLVASVFISPYEPPKVNYEKVLSFIGASLHLGSNSLSEASYYQAQQQQQQQLNGGSGYYHQDDQLQQVFNQPAAPQTPQQQQQQRQSRLTPPQSPTQLSPDRDLPRVLRQLEAEVAGIVALPERRDQPPINFESLRLAFQRADRLLRGTLSRDQLKRLVWDFRLPISEQTLDHVVALCRHRGGGQYDWEQFLGFMERVIPTQSTGLAMPYSRRPLDYARHYPEPNASWPHAEPQAAAQTLQLPAASSSAQQPLYRTPSPPPQQQQPQHQAMLTQRQAALAEPWFNRFMKLADALYRRDSQARGFLSESQMREVIERYNSELDLGIDRDALTKALDAARGGGNGGLTNINELLRRLGVRQGGRL
ncbi:hypothetical protein BOX15_Mlig006847g2, partial [Macrostomum lignano]